MNYHSWMSLEKSAPIFGYGVFRNKTINAREENWDPMSYSRRMFAWINKNLTLSERKQENQIVRNQRDCCQS